MLIIIKRILCQQNRKWNKISQIILKLWLINQVHKIFRRINQGDICLIIKWTSQEKVLKLRKMRLAIRAILSIRGRWKQLMTGSTMKLDLIKLDPRLKHMARVKKKLFQRKSKAEQFPQQIIKISNMENL